jgi:azurin
VCAPDGVEPSALSAPAGEVSLCARNDGQAPHDLAVRDATGRVLGRTPVLKPGESAVLSLALSPTRYALFCTLAGHESLGMKGTLEVQ